MLESFNGFELQYKKLSPEEMSERCILGRLVGPMCDTKKPTRNGRLYNKELWDKAFNDELFKEKLENKTILAELDHPADRTEIKTIDACAALAEMPKLGKDGLIYGVWDILDTAAGKVLNTLCKYGTKIGISSRGEGDIEESVDGEGDEVIPDTYSLETFDMVLMPSVKDARLNYVTESLDKKRNNKTLRKALTEELDKASADDRKVMESTLNNIGIKLNEEKLEETTSFDGLIYAEKLGRVMKAQGKSDEQIAEVFRLSGMSENEIKDTLAMLNIKQDSVKETKVNTNITEEVDVTSDNYDEFISRLTDMGFSRADILDHFLAWLPSDDIVDCLKDFAKDNDIDDYEDLDDELDEECNSGNCSDKKIRKTELVNSKTNEVVDNKSVVNDLQEVLRVKKDLEEKVMSLQSELAVSDTKAKQLVEELNRYKSLSAKLSTISKKEKSKTKELTENLEKTKKKLNAQLINEKRKVFTESYKTKTELAKANKSMSSKDTEIKKLKENLKDSKANLEVKSLDFEKQLKKQKQLAESYKIAANKIMSNYIDAKAQMIDVDPIEIKQKLKNNYSLEAVDKLCESLQERELALGSLPFKVGNKVTAKFTKLKTDPLLEQFNDGIDDDVDEDLIAMANQYYN